MCQSVNQNPIISSISVEPFFTSLFIQILFQINPLQKVPALVIGDEVISDSHAIALYLCQRNENQNVYPEDDIILKARVDEMLFYNATTLFPVNSAIYVSDDFIITEI